MTVISDNDVSIATMLQGAVVEKVDDEIRKVAENIMDPNTDPEAVRTVTLVLRVKPSKTRETASVTVNAIAKLANPRPVPTTVILARTTKGTVMTELISRQQPLFEDGNGKPIPPPPRHLEERREARSDEQGEEDT